MDPTAATFDAPYDAGLHLLDRQVIDSDDLLVCKVDDVELTKREDGLYATGLLVGRAALIPRLGGRAGRLLGDYWERLGVEQSDRRLPYRIDFSCIEEVTSAVHLRVPRLDLLRRQSAEETHRRRLGRLLGMTARHVDGRALGDVLDVRVDESQRLVGLLLGPGRPGSMLGYDRSADQGPALIRAVVRWLHRHAGYAEWDQLVSLDWEHGTVVVRGDLAPLSASR